MSRGQNTEDINNLISQISELKITLQNAIRPPEHVIYDDVELRSFLNVSKRTTAYWREKGLITFSKLGGKIFYRLSDILILLKNHEIKSVNHDLKVTI